MYDFQQYDGTIDNWEYENHLTGTLDNIENNNLYPELDTFMHVLVPYVAGLFFRGPDYELRRQTVPASFSFGKEWSDDNINGSRMMTLQRILAIVTAAKWCYFTTAPGTSLILPDIGLCRAHDKNQPVWIVPVGPTSLFEIKLRKKGHIANYMPGKRVWTPVLGIGSLTSEQVTELNREMQRQSFDQCFAQNPQLFDTDYPNKSVMEKKARGNDIMNIDSYFSSEELIAHEFEWYSIARIAAEHLSPTNAKKFVPNRPEIYMGKDRWNPPMTMLPSNLTPFKSGITICGRKMFLELHAPKDFDSHILG